MVLLYGFRLEGSKLLRAKVGLFMLVVSKLVEGSRVEGSTKVEGSRVVGESTVVGVSRVVESSRVLEGPRLVGGSNVAEVVTFSLSSRVFNVEATGV